MNLLEKKSFVNKGRQKIKKKKGGGKLFYNVNLRRMAFYSLTLSFFLNAEIEFFTVCSLTDGPRLRRFPTGLKLPVKRQGCEFLPVIHFHLINHFILKNIMLAGYGS